MRHVPATALIAEDESLLAMALRADLAAVWPGLQVLAQVGDGESAVTQALALRPDVCFLDIRMPAMTGLEAAQALAEDWPPETPFPLLVFITAYDQYAVQAFEREAVDYLLKPVDRARLQQAAERLQRQLAARRQAAVGTTAPDAAATLEQAVLQLRQLLASPPVGAAPAIAGASAVAPAPAPTAPAPRLEVIQAGVGSLLHLVPVDEVVYFEAADKYVRVMTAEREHLIRLSLRELLPRLDPQVFWQVHRSLVVQARCIATARREESGKVTLTLRGRPEVLTASRLYAHLFRGL